MKARVGDIELHYEIAGDGPWVTLAHAISCDSSMWNAQMDALTRRYRVLRFDTRGHGFSQAQPGPATIQVLAADACGLLDALGIARTHWVGLSMGGVVGQAFALAYPDRLESLVLVDTIARSPPGAHDMWGGRIERVRAQGMGALVDDTLTRWFTPAFRAVAPDVMAHIGGLVAATPVEGYAACARALAANDQLDRLVEVRCPALVIVGEEDRGTPVAVARLIHERIAASEMLVIPAAGHLPNVEQPEVFNRALLDFLDRVSAGA